MPKELSNNEFNAKVFADIQKLQDKIDALKLTLKPVELIQNASLAECNRIAREQKIKAAQAKREAEDNAFKAKVAEAVKEAKDGTTTKKQVD